MSPARLPQKADPLPQARRRKFGWIILGAAIVAALVAGVLSWPPKVDIEPRETAVPPPSYPISGYFITANTEASANRKKLQDIHAIGGDTVITFGTLLRPAAEEDLPAECTVNGVNCALAVAGSLKVNRYFTYSDGARWGDATHLCPRDRSVTSNGMSYTVLVLPNEGTECSSPDGSYNVVVVGGTKPSDDDPAEALAAAATELDMDFFPGLPAPVKRTDVEYLPDLTYSQTLGLFTERFLRYQADKNDVAGLAGFYHHVEMPVSSSAFFDPILSLYEMQNQAIHRVLPTRSALISPYIESRKSGSNVGPDDARPAMRKIAQTASGLKLNIAIQDGMGTGKGAAYLASEADSPVDIFAASIVGHGTWREKYVAPNKEYFRAAADGVSGTGAELWANLEGMAPSTKTNNCSNSLRGQTTVERMDRQLQHMGEATKVVSFMWDPYFTCKGTGTPMKSQLSSGYKVPIITGTTLDENARVLTVSGFNLLGGEAVVAWKSVDGHAHEHTSRAPSVISTAGGGDGPNPQLQSIRINIDEPKPALGNVYRLSVINQWGVRSDREVTGAGSTP